MANLPGQNAVPPAPPPRTPWWRRRWATVGELIAAAGLLVAGLSYWDAHRERVQTTTAERAQAEQQRARSVLVLSGSADAAGARIELHPLKDAQAVQSQRYLFPHAVLDHPMEVDAGQPQIDRAWIEDGLKRQVTGAAKAAGVKPEGEGELPAALVTTYVEDGQTREDRAIYRIGFRVERGGLLGGARLRLLGVSLVRHMPSGDLQAAVDGSWRGQIARGLAPLR